MGYGATFGILGGGGMAPLPPPPKSAYAWYSRERTSELFSTSQYTY